jgi:hypothetical protein
MKTVNIVVGIIAVVLVAVLSFLGSRPNPKPSYNAATETRVEGIVQEVQEFYCPVTEDRGSHLVLKTTSGPVLVHVGVARTLRANNITFSAGDRIQVLGSAFRYNKMNSLIAREISRGDETFTIRDAKGNLQLTD